MDRWKAGQWTARACVILLIVTACICFVGWSFAVPDCGHDPDPCYKIEMGSLADWANAIFTLLAFVAAAIAARSAYNANNIQLDAVKKSVRDAQGQRQLHLFTELAVPLIAQASEKFRACEISADHDSRMLNYGSFAYILRVASELVGKFGELDRSSVQAVGTALSHDFKLELSRMLKLEIVVFGEAAHVMKIFRDNNMTPTAENFKSTQNTVLNFGEDLRNFSRAYLSDFDDQEFSRRLEEIASKVVLVSRQNP